MGGLAALYTLSVGLIIILQVCVLYWDGRDDQVQATLYSGDNVADVYYTTFRYFMYKKGEN